MIDLERDSRLIHKVIREIKTNMIGKDDCIYKIMAAILAGGHILIDDIPGVGKTSLAMTFAKVLGLDSRRMQFTSDVLPSDVVGFSMYNNMSGRFEYQPGTVMCNLFLADEINRTSPKTQSALLEAMEERKVTVDGTTMLLPQPFVVMATQNPVGSVGTQMLPESQIDRFMVCLSIGYPSLEEEIAIVSRKRMDEQISEVKTVLSDGELVRLQENVKDIYVNDAMYQYICKLSQTSRNHPMVDLGISPRGTIALVSIAKAVAFIEGREFVAPQDVEKIFFDTVVHRLVLNSKARSSKMDAVAVAGQIFDRVKKPRVTAG